MTNKKIAEYIKSVPIGTTDDMLIFGCLLIEWANKIGNDVRIMYDHNDVKHGKIEIGFNYNKLDLNIFVDEDRIIVILDNYDGEDFEFERGILKFSEFDISDPNGNVEGIFQYLREQLDDVISEEPTLDK